jgi:hypothetical protein
MKRSASQALDIKEIFLSLEHELLSPQVRASHYRLDELLAHAFVEFGSSGRIYDKQSMIHALTQAASTENYQIDDFTIVTESDDTALVTYSCKIRSTDGDPVRASNRSSLWKLIDGRWRMAFHQGIRTK